MPDKLTELASQLQSSDAAARAAAAERICQEAEHAQPLALQLVDAMRDEAESVREWTSSALENLGPPLEEDLDELIARLQHANGDVAYWAATLIGRLGHDAQSAVAPLVTALASHNELAVRQRAAWALGKIGKAARAAKPALEAATKSDNARLKKMALTALEQIE